MLWIVMVSITECGWGVSWLGLDIRIIFASLFAYILDQDHEVGAPEEVQMEGH